MISLGKRIRQLRQAKGWTLAELAQHSGVVLSTLSRIETGRMTGTLESHIQIARALGVRLPELYQELDPHSQLVEHHPADETPPKLLHGQGWKGKFLARGAFQNKMLPLLITLAPGRTTGQEHTQDGTDRFLYCLKGELQVTVGGKEVHLAAGDSLYFRASLPHRFKNIGSHEAAVLTVTSPVSL